MSLNIEQYGMDKFLTLLQTLWYIGWNACCSKALIDLKSCCVGRVFKQQNVGTSIILARWIKLAHHISIMITLAAL
jgi:hypothetical protein